MKVVAEVAVPLGSRRRNTQRPRTATSTFTQQLLSTLTELRVHNTGPLAVCSARQY